jgi:hypothetical protein
MKLFWLFILFAFILSNSILDSYAQILTPDSTSQQQSLKPEHSPKKAAYLSLVLPGLGQAYNKKYWKIPIVYGALGAVAYFWTDNNTKYIGYRDAYISRIDNDLTNDELLYPGYSAEDLRELKNYHWRYRDLNAFIFFGVWALNILDAVVDAHLYTFDMNENLTLQIQPAMINSMAFGKESLYGIAFNLKF